MAGINFNDLPKNLQAKLEPYMTIGGAKTVEEAVAKAKDAKNWTAEDDKQLSSLNGGANWGKTMDEYAFNSTKANEYKANLPQAKKENQLAQARRRNSIEFTLNIEETQAELDKKRAELKRSIVEKRSQGFTGYLSAMVDKVKLDMTPEKAGLHQAGVGGVAGRFLAAAAIAAFTVMNVRCTPEDKTDINIGQQVNVTLSNSSQLNEALKRILELLQKIDDNNAKNFQSLLSTLQIVINNQYDSKESMEKAIDKAVKAIIDWLEKIYNKEVDIQTDNNKNAADIAAQLAAILASSKSMEEKLQAIIELLGKIKGIGEDILAAIKAAKDEVIAVLNTNNEAVLAALAKLDENDQKSLTVLEEIRDLIKEHGDAGKVFAQDVLIALGKIGGTGKDYTDLLNDIIDLLKKLDGKGDVVVEGMNAILEAIKNLPDYSAKLDAIIEKLKALGDKADEILKAIKDHNVKITVDVTGKVKCECNCNCGNGGVHEGILGDLNDLLG